MKAAKNKVDQLAAMKITVQLAKDNPWWAKRDGTTVLHLESMLERALRDPEMDEAKLGRWLGWMQAILVVHSPKEFTLDDMKELNKGCKFSVKGKRKKK